MKPQAEPIRHEEAPGEASFGMRKDELAPVPRARAENLEAQVMDILRRYDIHKPDLEALRKKYELREVTTEDLEKLADLLAALDRIRTTGRVEGPPDPKEKWDWEVGERMICDERTIKKQYAVIGSREVSPDGEQFAAIVQVKKQVHKRQPIEPGPSIVLVNGEVWHDQFPLYQGLAWSPDGQHLAVTANNGELIVIDR